MSGKSSVLAALGVITCALVALIVIAAPPLAQHDSVFLVACGADFFAVAALWLPIVTASRSDATTAWFRLAPAAIALLWLVVAVGLTFWTMANTVDVPEGGVPRDEVGWKSVAIPSVLLATLWALVTFSGAAGASSVKAEEASMADANERFERIKGMAGELRAQAQSASAPVQLRVQKLVSALTYAPRARFRAEEPTQALMADLETLLHSVSTQPEAALQPVLEQAERRLRELGLSRA